MTPEKEWQARLRFVEAIYAGVWSRELEDDYQRLKPTMEKGHLEILEQAREISAEFQIWLKNHEKKKPENEEAKEQMKKQDKEDKKEA